MILSFKVNPITDEFKRTKQAPMTSHKQLMIATEDSGFEGLAEVREIISGDHKYINKTCLSQTDLYDQILFEHPEIEISKAQVRNILKKLGYSLSAKRVKVDGSAKQIWVKMAMTNEEIRESFSA